MKKTILFLCLLTASFIGVKAQGSFSYTATNPTGAILNNSVDTMSYTMAHGYNYVGIQPKFVRATGTMAGTAILSYSINGTDYVNTDTLTLTNAATNSTIWIKTGAVRYWRIIRSGATTVTGTSSAKIISSTY